MRAGNSAGGYKETMRQRKEFWAKEITWANVPLLQLLRFICHPLISFFRHLFFTSVQALFLIESLNFINLNNPVSCMMVILRGPSQCWWEFSEKLHTRTFIETWQIEFCIELLSYLLSGYRIWVRWGHQQSYSWRSQTITNQRCYPQSSHILQSPQILGGLGHCSLRRKLSTI